MESNGEASVGELPSSYSSAVATSSAEIRHRPPRLAVDESHGIEDAAATDRRLDLGYKSLRLRADHQSDAR